MAMTNQKAVYTPPMIDSGSTNADNINAPGGVTPDNEATKKSDGHTLDAEIDKMASNPYTYMPATLGQPDESKTTGAMERGYSTEQSEAELARAQQNARNVADKYGTDQRGADVDPYYLQNQAQNNKMGNLNNKSFDDTLALSRLADNVNNSLWWTTPNDIGNGAVGTSAYTAQQLNGLEKRSPIETQEMRQMRANEEVDATARKYATELQAKAFELSYNAITKNMEIDNDLTRQLGMTNIDIYKSMRQAVIDVDYRLPAQTFYQQVLTKFNSQLEMWLLGQKSNLLAWVQKNAPSIIQYVAQLCATSPQSLSNAYESSYTSNMLQQIDNDTTLTPEQKIQAKALLDTYIKAGIVYSDYNTYRQLIFSNNPSI